MKHTTHIHLAATSADSAIILLPGRGGAAMGLIAQYQQKSGLANTTFVGVEPDNEWYPAPHGPLDQEDAIAGLPAAVDAIKKVLEVVQQKHGIGPEKTAIVGYSAGAVVAIETAMHLEQPIGAVVVHCGTILDPDAVEAARNQTPILLTHNTNDTVFEWNSRYNYMKKALIKNNYNVSVIEKKHGGHTVSNEDVLASGLWLSQRLDVNYHSHYEKPTAEIYKANGRDT